MCEDRISEVIKEVRKRHEDSKSLYDIGTQIQEIEYVYNAVLDNIDMPVPKIYTNTINKFLAMNLNNIVERETLLEFEDIILAQQFKRDIDQSFSRASIATPFFRTRLKNKLENVRLKYQDLLQDQYYAINKMNYHVDKLIDDLGLVDQRIFDPKVIRSKELDVKLKEQLDTISSTLSELKGRTDGRIDEIEVVLIKTFEALKTNLNSDLRLVTKNISAKYGEKLTAYELGEASIYFENKLNIFKKQIEGLYEPKTTDNLYTTSIKSVSLKKLMKIVEKHTDECKQVCMESISGDFNKKDIKLCQNFYDKIKVFENIDTKNLSFEQKVAYAEEIWKLADKFNRKFSASDKDKPISIIFDSLAIIVLPYVISYYIINLLINY